jgi:hypothetical protein
MENAIAATPDLELRKIRKPLEGRTLGLDVINEKRRQIQTKLHARLATSRGMDWELLKLELQNDWFVLIDNFNHWMTLLDSDFAGRNQK